MQHITLDIKSAMHAIWPIGDLLGVLETEPPSAFTQEVSTQEVLYFGCSLIRIHWHTEMHNLPLMHEAELLEVLES